MNPRPLIVYPRSTVEESFDSVLLTAYLGAGYDRLGDRIDPVHASEVQHQLGLDLSRIAGGATFSRCEGVWLADGEHTIVEEPTIRVEIIATNVQAHACVAALAKAAHRLGQTSVLATITSGRYFARITIRPDYGVLRPEGAPAPLREERFS